METAQIVLDRAIDHRIREIDRRALRHLGDDLGERLAPRFYRSRLVQLFAQIAPQFLERIDVADRFRKIIVERQQVSLLETFESDRVAQGLTAQRFVDASVILCEWHREPGRLPDAQTPDSILDRLQEAALTEDKTASTTGSSTFAPSCWTV